MTKDEERAQTLIELGEAELAVIKQERVLQHLLDTREPTEEARTLLERLRKVVATLSEKPAPVPAAIDDAA
jgi:hypothetical protein